jgi:CRP-like cAMP-binding protein
VALRKDAKIELLKKVPLFAGCSKKELAQIAMIADEVHLPEGKTLIREGSRGSEFFVLLDGTVRVSRKGRKLAELDAGTHFGEIALISDVPRTATVEATTPVRVLVVVDRAFDDLMRRMPGIAVNVLGTLAERVKPDVTS